MEEGSGSKPTAGPLASQSPHVFWIGGDRLLGVAGGYSPDVVGGAALHPLSFGSSQGRGGITFFFFGWSCGSWTRGWMQL